MYKFRNAVIGLTGLLTLAGIATVGVPKIARSAGGTGGGAPTTQTQNVRVVNTSSEPLPATVTPVNGSIWNVNAQQSGPWNVGIDAAANTVKVDTTNPLPVRDMDNPARQPFTASFEASFEKGRIDTFAKPNSSVVPAGKRLVVENVSALVRLPPGEKLVATEVYTIRNINHNPVFNSGVWLGSNFQGTLGAVEDWFIASQAVRLYADSSEGGPGEVLLKFTRAGFGDDTHISATISGYLVDIP
jgi:hypothetical protein